MYCVYGRSTFSCGGMDKLIFDTSVLPPVFVPEGEKEEHSQELEVAGEKHEDFHLLLHHNAELPRTSDEKSLSPKQAEEEEISSEIISLLPESKPSLLRNRPKGAICLESRSKGDLKNEVVFPFYVDGTVDSVSSYNVFFPDETFKNSIPLLPALPLLHQEIKNPPAGEPLYRNISNKRTALVIEKSVMSAEIKKAHDEDCHFSLVSYPAASLNDTASGFIAVSSSDKLLKKTIKDRFSSKTAVQKTIESPLSRKASWRGRDSNDLGGVKSHAEEMPSYNRARAFSSREQPKRQDQYLIARPKSSSQAFSSSAFTSPSKKAQDVQKADYTTPFSFPDTKKIVGGSSSGAVSLFAKDVDRELDTQPLTVCSPPGPQSSHYWVNNAVPPILINLAEEVKKVEYEDVFSFEREENSFTFNSSIGFPEPNAKGTKEESPKGYGSHDIYGTLNAALDALMPVSDELEIDPHKKPILHVAPRKTTTISTLTTLASECASLIKQSTDEDLEENVLHNNSFNEHLKHTSSSAVEVSSFSRPVRMIPLKSLTTDRKVGGTLEMTKNRDISHAKLPAGNESIQQEEFIPVMRVSKRIRKIDDEPISWPAVHKNKDSTDIPQASSMFFFKDYKKDHQSMTALHGPKEDVGNDLSGKQHESTHIIHSTRVGLLLASCNECSLVMPCLEVSYDRCSPSGKKIIIANNEGLWVYSTITGEVLLYLECLENNEFPTAVFNASEDKILTKTAKKVKLWSISEKKLLGSIEFNTVVKTAVFSDDGKSILAVSKKEAYLWLVEPFFEPERVPSSDCIELGVFNPRSDSFVIKRDKEAALFDKSGQFLYLFKYDKHIVNVTFTSDSKKLLFEFSKKVELVDLRNREVVLQKERSHIAFEKDVHSPKKDAFSSEKKHSPRYEYSKKSSTLLSPDGKLLAVGHKKGVDLYNTDHHHKQYKELITAIEWSGRNKIYPEKFSLNSTKVLIKSRDGDRAWIWNPRAEGVVELPEGIVSTELSPDGTKAFSLFSTNQGSVLHAITVDPLEEEPLKLEILRVFPDVLHAAFSFDGKKLFTVSTGKTGDLWDISHQKNVVLIQHFENSTTGHFSQKSDTLFVR